MENDSDTLIAVRDDAKSYLASLHQLAQREAELANDYRDGDYDDFTDDQAYLTGPQNDLQRKLDDLTDDAADAGIQFDDGDSDYEVARTCLDYCNQHLANH